MVLKFLRVEDAGNLENERVVFQASADIRIGKYIVLQSKKSPDGKVFSSAVPSAYWFASIDVKKDDFVILYSKPGERSQKNDIENGSNSYFFYWGLEQSIWSFGFKPTMITAATWEWMKD